MSLKPYTDVVLEHLGIRQSRDRDDEDEPADVKQRGGRGRGAKRGAVKELKDQYHAVWSRAVEMEFQEEWTESNERLKQWPRCDSLSNLITPQTTRRLTSPFLSHHGSYSGRD